MLINKYKNYLNKFKLKKLEEQKNFEYIFFIKINDSTQHKLIQLKKQLNKYKIHFFFIKSSLIKKKIPNFLINQNNLAIIFLNSNNINFLNILLQILKENNIKILFLKNGLKIYTINKLKNLKIKPIKEFSLNLKFIFFKILINFQRIQNKKAGIT